MDAESALAELKKISLAVDDAVVFDATGTPLASTYGDDERARVAAARAGELLAAADEVRPPDAPPVTQVEAVTGPGAVFVVREGEKAVVATTGPEPTVGLVMYDLRTCLRSLAPEKAAPARRSRKKAPSA